MTIKKIKSLRPEFKFGGITMVDWFEVINSDSFCIIRSGLRHADGVTKSPFYYEEVTIGKKSAKDAVNKFTKWWNEIKK
jgi:hypothetical protein